MTAIARANPVAKLGASVFIALALLLSIDPVSASVALVLDLLVLPWAGLGFREFWLRTSPLWISAPLAGLTTALWGVDSGATLLTIGPITVTQGSLALGGAIALRVLAIGIPGIVLFATTDPTDLADGLAQVLHLPSRFVLGGLAGLRLVGLFVEDWRALRLARRARGVADGRGPIGAARTAASSTFALLVLAIRRAGALATAMEARGFGAPVRRTWARPSPFGGREWMLVFGGILVGAASIAIAVETGTWRFILT